MGSLPKIVGSLTHFQRVMETPGCTKAAELRISSWIDPYCVALAKAHGRRGERRFFRGQRECDTQRGLRAKELLNASGPTSRTGAPENLAHEPSKSPGSRREMGRRKLES